MAGAVGLDAQFGYAEESTFGTYVAPSRYLLFKDESLALSYPPLESDAIGGGQRVERTDQFAPGRREAGGDVHAEVCVKGWGLFFKHMLGAIATTADGTGKKHSATVANLFGKSLSLQVGKPSTNNTVNPFSYTGCKIAKWNLKESVDGFLEATISFDSRDEDTAQTLGAVSVPTAEIFNWNDLVITVAGSNVNNRDAEIDGTTPLNTGRFFQGQTLKKEQLEMGKRVFAGKLTGEFESMTAYNRFISKALVPIVFTFTAVSTYDTAKPYKLVVTMPNCRFDGTTPIVKGPDVLDQELPFKALDDGTGAIVIDYYTSDAAP